MKYISSPLRYPGGKSVLTDYLVSVIKLNNLGNCKYIEPYAGGAGAALNLLFLEHVNEILINDADYNIFCFWNSVLNETNRLIDLINETEVNMDNWRMQKDVILKPKKYSKLKIGFATFFLNRCNRSGIITGGPIGGCHQLGKWKIDARYNKPDLIERIKKIAYHKERISLSNLDALELINSILSKGGVEGCFFFLDPPYFEKGQDLYLNYYVENDHENLAHLLNSGTMPSWVLTYDNVPQVVSLYRNKRFFNYDINYSANNHRKGREIIIFSDNLRIPHHQNSCL